MAELACFCYPIPSDNGFKFLPFNRSAIKCMLNAKIDKSMNDKFYNTYVYGVAPPPQFRKRFATLDNNRGMYFDTPMYDKVACMLSSVLNTMKIDNIKMQSLMSRIVSVRHLESLVRRSENVDDCLAVDKDIKTKAVLIALRESDEVELTTTAEGGKIVFQNAAYTMWKLEYNTYELMPIKDETFEEYKITLNDVKPVNDVHVKEMVTELRWQYNKFATITHGKGHYRVVKYSTVAAHADRVFASFKSEQKSGMQVKFDTLDSRIIWQNWSAFITSMLQGTQHDVAKKLIFQKMKPERSAFKGVSSDRKFDEVSRVGA
nr:NSP2 [Rotavirus A type 2]